MDKIYSRTKLKFNNELQSKNIKKIFKILIILLISISLANAIIKKADPIISGQCIAIARAVIIKVSNEEAAKVMENYKYDDLLNVIKDENGNIKMIETNIITINKIITEIPYNIQVAMGKEANNTFAIPIGNLTGTKTLSGRGPSIVIKCLNTNNLETNLISEFTEKGINQTLHRIYLDVKYTTIVSTPYKIFQGEVNNKVLLAERVIVGEIPETYYNLNGIKSDDTLNVIE